VFQLKIEGRPKVYRVLARHCQIGGSKCLIALILWLHEYMSISYMSISYMSVWVYECMSILVCEYLSVWVCGYEYIGIWVNVCMCIWVNWVQDMLNG